jgi:hypothetical protein
MCLTSLAVRKTFSVGAEIQLCQVNENTSKISKARLACVSDILAPTSCERKQCVQIHRPANESKKAGELTELRRVRGSVAVVEVSSIPWFSIRPMNSS